MKRIAVTILSLALAVTLISCGSSHNPASPGSAPTAASTVVQEAATSVTSTTSETPTEQPAEQLSEFGTNTSTTAPDESDTALALKTSTTPAPTSSRWKEGVNYKRLVPAQPTSAAPGQVEVMEVFWYGCPHCNALDPFLETWRKNGKAPYVSFVRMPVMWGVPHRNHARVFYTAEQLGKLDALHTAIFHEIQVNNDPLQEPEQIQKFFSSHGVSQAEFQKAFASFAVETSLKRAETLGLRYKVESVPLIIINGKYVTDVGQAGGHEQLISLINELAAGEHGA